MSKIFSDNTTMSGINENPRMDTKNTSMPQLCLNDINLLFDLGQMAAILDFLPTMQCRKYFLTMPLCLAYFQTL